MRHGSNFLAFVQDRLARLLRFPNPKAQLWPFVRNGLCKFTQDLFVNGGPKLQKRHGAVETHVQRSVVCVVETLEQSERCRRIAVGVHLASPKRAAIRESIKLIEKHPSIPSRLVFVIDIRLLPGVDGVAPLGGVEQAIASDNPRIAAVGAIKVGVLPVPLTALAKLHDRKIPRNYHRNDFLLAGLKSKFDRDGPAQFLTGADPRSITVRKLAVLGERSPNGFAIAVG